MIFDQAVTIVRAGRKTDRYGNEVPDWSPGAVTRTAWERVSVQPYRQDETADGTRDARITGWRIYSEPGTDADVSALDRVELPAVLLGEPDPAVCEVLGEVARWPDPLTGGIHHVEVLIQRVKG